MEYDVETVGLYDTLLGQIVTIAQTVRDEGHFLGDYTLPIEQLNKLVQALVIVKKRYGKHNP